MNLSPALRPLNRHNSSRNMFDVTAVMIEGTIGVPVDADCKFHTVVEKTGSFHRKGKKNKEKLMYSED